MSELKSVVDHDQDVQLLRFLFVLPEPIAVPDGFQFSASFPDPALCEPESDAPFAALTFHQVDVQGGRTESTFRAMLRVTATAPDLPKHKKKPMARRRAKVTASSVPIQHTVVDAVTVAESPESIPEGQPADPATWSPRSDALTRCIAVADQALRVHRQAAEALHGALTYVRMTPPVLCYQAKGRRLIVAEGDEIHSITTATEAWSGPSVVLLEHSNLADPFMGKDWDDDVATRFEYWYREHRRGNPLLLWRERFADARRALHATGDPSAAVLFANTSCEVLLDTVLALLIWEEGFQAGHAPDPSGAAPVFEQGKTMRRVTRELPGRLGGSWTTDAGALGAWNTNAYRLRHRIVHGGYAANMAEAQQALQAATGLQQFLWERLAIKRTIYPRSALMVLGAEGLQRRNLWSGRIRRFSDEVGPTEADWRDDFSAFYANLMAAVLDQAGS